MKFILLANGGIPLLFESWLLVLINIPLAFIEFTSLFLLIKFQTNQTVPVYAFFFIFLGNILSSLLFVPVGMVAGTGNVGEYSFFFLLLLSLIASIIIEFPFYHFSVYKLGELELSKLIFFGYLVCIHLVSYLILVGSFFAFR